MAKRITICIDVDSDLVDQVLENIDIMKVNLEFQIKEYSKTFNFDVVVDNAKDDA